MEVVLLSRRGSFWFAFVVQVWNCDFVLLFRLLSLSRVLKDRSFTRTFVLLCYSAMSQKENIISELHTRKGTWKIVVRITNLCEVRKQNSKQAIEMVLMDQTGTKIGATIWQELFTEFRHKLHCGSSYLIQNLRIVDNQSEYKVSLIPLLVYFVRTMSVKEIQRPEIPPNVYMITLFADIISGVAPRHTLVDIVGVVADLIDVKTINPPHRMTVRLRDNSNSDIIMTVWEDYAIQLHHAIDKNLLLQEPLIAMLSLGKIKDAIDKYPLSVQNIKYGSRLYVNTDIAKIQQFRNSLCVPFYSGGITDDNGGSQSQSSQSNLVEKFLHNAQVVSIGEINNLKQSYDSCPCCTTTFDPSKVGSAYCSCQNRMNDTVPSIMGTKETSLSGMQHVSRCLAGDDIKVFPPCVDEILSKTWVVRFKYHSQLRQSSVLYVSEEPHYIQTLTTTLGLKGEASTGKAIAVEPESSPPIYYPTNFIQIPLACHRQWRPTYLLYVTFDYNGEKHFIKVRRDGNKFYFVDGLKDFRRALGIHEGLVVHFATPDRNTNFYLQFMPPLDRQTSGRPYSITRTYIFTVDITNHIISTPTPLVLPPNAVDIIGYRYQYLTVEAPRGHQIWRMSIQDGLQTLTTPWYQFLRDNNLMARDEIVFYYRPNQEIKLQMDNYAERRKRRKIILQQKIKCPVTNVNFQYTSQCSPTFNDHNPTTSSQCTPSTNITLSMNRCRHHSIDHTINVSFIQRNLMSSYDNKKIKQPLLHPHANPEDQFVIHDLLDCTDDDVNMTQENMDIDYSFNDPTIDYLDDYDDQSILAASFEYQNTGSAYIDIRDPVWECQHCKAMMWYDERINKDKQSRKQRFSLCCSDGKIQLPLLQQLPHPLNYLLFNDHDPIAKNFQQNIRSYNLMFAFTSPGIKIDTSYNTGRGPPTFRIHGQTHHLIGSLIPMPNNLAKFAQLYIYDTNNEINNRLSQNPSIFILIMHRMLNEDIIIGIKNMLDDHNHYAQKFRMAKEKLQSIVVPGLKLKLFSQRQTNGRLYNLPTTVEVFALIVGDEHTTDKRDIIIEKQFGLLNRIHEFHHAYLLLQYPLLYPKGEDGYRANIPHKDHVNIHIAKRKKSITNEAQTILHSRRVFQQWIVDGYCTIESQKLKYVRQHQQQLRVDKYINLNTSNDHPETLGRDKGKRIILPSSFVGGQRYMEQLYFDGMTICGHLGFLDLFLTLTSNPTWPEI
ncbi:Replication protein A DNA-binding subunit A [Glycine soja]